MTVFTGVEDTVAGGVDTTDALAEVVLPEFRSGYQRWDLAFQRIALPLIVRRLFSSGVGGRHLLVVELLLEPEDLLEFDLESLLFFALFFMA